MLDAIETEFAKFESLLSQGEIVTNPWVVRTLGELRQILRDVREKTPKSGPLTHNSKENNDD